MADIETEETGTGRDADRQRNFFLQLQQMLAALTSGVVGMFGGFGGAQASQQGGGSNIVPTGNTQNTDVARQYVDQATQELTQERQASLAAQLGEEVSISSDAPEARTMRIIPVQGQAYGQTPSALAYQESERQRAAYKEGRSQAEEHAEAARRQYFASHAELATRNDLSEGFHKSKREEIAATQERALQEAKSMIPQQSGIFLSTEQKREVAMVGNGPSGNTEWTEDRIFEARETGNVINVPFDKRTGESLGQVLVERVGNGTYRVSVIDANINVNSPSTAANPA